MTNTNRNVKLGVLLWFRLSRFYNKSNRKSNQHLKEFGLNVAQLDLLAQIGHNKSISQQELADKLLVSKGNIAQLLKKMEEQNLIERKQEWKTKYVSLTEKGTKLYSEVIPQQEMFQAAQFDALTDTEKKQLLHLLKKIQK
ncbi:MULTISPECIES: MarR family transcriptional regulator [unclassified Niallia]|uniref:MarR family winged helix-turn-helix transcriptional regulator n=1 Tax=unclassified Niallia TaxID=2837522 RepID=UPI001EDB47B6|nr:MULTISPECIES: MarR family transcriptional regulator [unclassified Niallia]MCM3031211.1 MarR family transcriptional regulator [Niallia sp. MER 6]MDL0434787.1 MarR family transcriptional regulator [Niallia sp. SS-2023]UPO89391.1 MarR family transcriptional regulator [Niallia sp. Man26]